MKKRVLIYDDDKDILALCRTLLQKREHIVEVRSVCERVVIDMLDFKPDLVLMDLWIPELGGEKAIQLVKKNQMISSIPIYVFSANANIVEISQSIGADGYLAKPFDIKHFLEVVEAI